jgi:hypothetical protein
VKECFRCNAVLPLDSFYRHPMMKDGHVNKCKNCNKADVRANYAKRRDQYKQYEQRPQRIASSRRRIKESKEKHATKHHVRVDTNILVATGKIKKQPCAVCGSERAEKHHPDYFRPIYVVWLCRQHHADEHRRLRDCHPDTTGDV